MNALGIRIISEAGKIMSKDVKVFSGNTEINGICDITIRITPESFILADMTVLVSELNINADAIIKKACKTTIEGNDKISRIKRMIENIIYNEEKYSDNEEYKKYVTMIAECCLKEIEKD